MKIALVGYGKMGRRIDALAAPYGEVVLRLDETNNADGSAVNLPNFEPVDVAIDFSHPSVVAGNLRRVIATSTPVVVGTTGWLDEAEAVRDLAVFHGVPVLYGSNFSLGVQRFMKLVERAGELFGGQADIHAAIHETHHIHKADAPSGTALTAGERWLEGSKRGGKPVYGIASDHPVDPDALVITSQRVGDVTGEHTLRLRGPFDDLEIRHGALSRDAFAIGALKAAKWLLGQKPDLYFIERVIEEIG